MRTEPGTTAVAPASANFYNEATLIALDVDDEAKI